MEPSQQTLLIEKLLAAIAKRVPQYLANPKT